jgi:hypothetical protein
MASMGPSDFFACEDDLDLILSPSSTSGDFYLTWAERGQGQPEAVESSSGAGTAEAAKAAEFPNTGPANPDHLAFEPTQRLEDILMLEAASPAVTSLVCSGPSAAQAEQHNWDVLNTAATQVVAEDTDFAATQMVQE